MTALPERPVFGRTLVTLPHASADNPIRTGLYVETITIPRGEINAGKHYRVTDGRGAFWLAPAAVAELAAEQPEAAAAGELPAEVERAVEQALPCIEGSSEAPLCGDGDHLDCPAAFRPDVLAALKPLWPAPPPPAAGEAIVSAIERALRVEPYRGEAFTICELVGDDVVGEIEDRVASALRSIELASAARAARLEALLREVADFTCLSPAGAARDSDEAESLAERVEHLLLDAPPSDPWAAVQELSDAARALADEIEEGDDCDDMITNQLANALMRVRGAVLALGLPPKETDHAD